MVQAEVEITSGKGPSPANHEGAPGYYRDLKNAALRAFARTPDSPNCVFVYPATPLHVGGFVGGISQNGATFVDEGPLVGTETVSTAMYFIKIYPSDQSSVPRLVRFSVGSTQRIIQPDVIVKKGKEELAKLREAPPLKISFKVVGPDEYPTLDLNTVPVVANEPTGLKEYPPLYPNLIPSVSDVDPGISEILSAGDSISLGDQSATINGKALEESQAKVLTTLLNQAVILDYPAERMAEEQRRSPPEQERYSRLRDALENPSHLLARREIAPAEIDALLDPNLLLALSGYSPADLPEEVYLALDRNPHLTRAVLDQRIAAARQEAQREVAHPKSKPPDSPYEDWQQEKQRSEELRRVQRALEVQDLTALNPDLAYLIEIRNPGIEAGDVQDAEIDFLRVILQLPPLYEAIPATPAETPENWSQTISAATEELPTAYIEPLFQPPSDEQMADYRAKVDLQFPHAADASHLARFRDWIEAQLESLGSPETNERLAGIRKRFPKL